MNFETKETSVDAQALIERIGRYAGKSISERNAPRNPNLTARETIVLADYIRDLEIEVALWRSDYQESKE